MEGMLVVDTRNFPTGTLFYVYNGNIQYKDVGMQNAENDKLLPFIEKYRFNNQEITRKVNNVANGYSKILMAINQIINNILILLLAFMLLDDMATVGGAVFIMLVLPYFTNAVQGLVNVNLGLVDVKVANEFFKEIAENCEQNGEIVIERIDKIEFDIDEISIKDNVLIENVKLELKKGDIVGIMGESGTGKSTLAKILAKFRYTDGVCIDGTSINKIDNDSYLKLVSYYSQNAPIINESIHDNLNFGKSPISKQKYESLQFLSKFKNLDEMILENGANLSAGDKQRISLARFFVEDAQLVILDEPTSSLDKETETTILSDILKSNKDKIILLISHNPENMKYCNRVYNLENKILEEIK